MSGLCMVGRVRLDTKVYTAKVVYGLVLVFTLHM